jgi:hypothetical protein
MDDADSDTLYERRMLALGVRGELAAAGIPIAAVISPDDLPHSSSGGNRISSSVQYTPHFSMQAM